MQDKEKILLKAIGKVIKKVRKEKELKFTIFCYENDISKTTLHMVENGKNKPIITSLAKIIEALGISYSDFGRLLDQELPKEYFEKENLF